LDLFLFLGGVWMTYQELEQKLEDLYQELAMYTRQMDRENTSQTRRKIVELERTLHQEYSNAT
jgi:hypothetical protein